MTDVSNDSKALKESLIHYENLYNCDFGLERETLRIGQDGLLSRQKHPFEGDPNIERDFCENQIEIITPICGSINHLYDSLDLIDRRVRDKLLVLEDSEHGVVREYLWPFSNPPYISEGSIQVAEYHGSMKDKEIYRHYLSEKYGKKQMLFCGIHFNFSYSDIYLKQTFEKSGFSDFIEFKNDIYLDLAKKVYAYSWLIVYLTAASPVYDNSFDTVSNLAGRSSDESARSAFNGEASLRNGIRGYWNTFVPVLNYSDIKSYTGSIDNYVKRGQLHSASECYLPVRVKPKGENTLERLAEAGINHIELRMLDINPLARLGIFKEDLEFIHLFLIYLTCSERSGEFDKTNQQNAVINHKRAAQFDCSNVLIGGIPLITAGIEILNNIKQFFLELKKDKEISIIESVKQRLLYPKQRYAQRIYDLFHENYMEKGLELAKYYSEREAADLGGDI